ncbi:MAG: 30S ribosomal protein S7 [Methanosarcinales archaeon Met12]|nr:MAG: 30S ribosomal protein S7 [Methanosarcinales archaeon Met12]
MSKIFEKWDVSDIKIDDPGIREYVNIKAVSVHTGGKISSQQGSKSEISIIERLITKMMQKGHNTGKKHKAYTIVRDAFDIIHDKTKESPIQWLVRAVENAGPKEETIKLRYGGMSVPKAVDASSQRRVDQALKFIARGAQKAAFRSKRSIEECLASEIIAVAKYDVKSYAISKKEEKERIAKAAR